MEPANVINDTSNESIKTQNAHHILYKLFVFILSIFQRLVHKVDDVSWASDFCFFIAIFCKAN
jgi:hypothetical protein